jgi:hypothetical protein
LFRPDPHDHSDQARDGRSTARAIDFELVRQPHGKAAFGGIADFLATTRLATASTAPRATRLSLVTSLV